MHPQALKFFEAVEASPSSCILDLEVVVEERCDRYSAMLYPANAARNRALVNAATGGWMGVGWGGACWVACARGEGWCAGAG